MSYGNMLDDSLWYMYPQETPLVIRVFLEISVAIDTYRTHC